MPDLSDAVHVYPVKTPRESCRPEVVEQFDLMMRGVELNSEKERMWYLKGVFNGLLRVSLANKAEAGSAISEMMWLATEVHDAMVDKILAENAAREEE